MLIYLAMLDTEDDRALFLRLYNTYALKCKAVANAILRDEHRAEDITHDAFLKILRHLKKFYKLNGNESRALIVTIVRRLSFDYLKSKDSNSVSLPEEFNPPDEDIRNDPLNFVVSRTTSQRLMELIVELGEPHTDVLMLKCVYDFTTSEMADILGISEPHVRSRLFRARKKLISQLGKEGILHG